MYYVMIYRNMYFIYKENAPDMFQFLFKDHI